MTKRDDDPQSQADMEVGMTTAERRRRRRRGGSLRVPSDNVPRRASTAPPVVAPVPEDPALAMSIAYSFSSDASEPVPRVDLPATMKAATPPTPARPMENPPLATDDSPSFDAPIAPDGMSTVIDPPTSTAVEPQEFEMKTREMSAVDLEALGLTEMAGKLNLSRPADDKIVEVRFNKPADHAPIAPFRGTTVIPTGDEMEMEIGVEVEGVEGGRTLETEAEDASEIDLSATTQLPAVNPDAEVESRPRRERIKTVALSDDDLEEVRDLVRGGMKPAVAEKIAAETVVTKAPVTPVPVKDEKEEVMSVPDIDIQMLSDRADAQDLQDSQDIEVDVDEEPVAAPKPVAAAPKPVAAAPTAPVAPAAPAPVAPAAPAPMESRPVPPAAIDARQVSGPTAIPPKPPAATEPRTRAASHPPPIATTPQPGHHAPPPPPPASAHKAPPAPPPAKKPAPTPLPPKETKSRGKPWFVDLFDEDYLRTLPFLTPQATQAEAEFVIDAMGLQPGAQVLDIGCGYGRHAMELAARGFHMVGLDISTPLLVRGGEESHRRGLTIDFVRGDMRELDFEGQFDGAYCLFSTFGYFDDETNKKTIVNIARALKPGGRVMIEILNRDYVIADLPTRIWWEGEGCVVLEEVELNYFSSRIQVNRSVVFDDGRQLEQEISVRAYSLHEVGKLMHAAGFRVLEVSGGYQTRGRFFGNQSRHIIVLAERKDTPTS